MYRKSLVAVMIAAALITTGCNPSSASEEASQEGPAGFAQVVKLSTVVAKSTTTALYEQVQGRVNPIKIAQIRPQVEGIIEARLFTQGDFVKKGTPLYQIDADSYQIEVETQRANVVEAENAYKKAQAQYERLKKLSETDFASQQNLDDARFSVGTAKGQWMSRKAQLNKAKLDLERTVVTAPIDGVIGEELITEGALVKPSDSSPLAVIRKVDQVYLDVQVPASMASRLTDDIHQSDRSLKVISPSGQLLSGKVVYSAVYVDEETSNVTLRAVVDNTSRGLLVGQFVRAQIPVGEVEAFAIPNLAVKHKSTGEAYLLVVKNGQLEERLVTTDGNTGGMTLVTSGVNEGEQVVVVGGENAFPGTSIETMEWHDNTKQLNG